MPTTSLYPSADGRIQKAGSSTWSTVRDATDGSSHVTGDVGFQVDKSSADYVIDRAYMIFDASSLSGATITALTLTIKTTVDCYCNSPSPVNYAYGTLVAFSPANPASVAVADFDQFGTTDLNSGGSYTLNASTTYTFTLSAAGLAVVNAQIASGYIKLGIRDTNFDLANSAIPNTKTCYAFWNGSEASGTSNDPVISVTYSTAAPVYISGSSSAAATGSLSLGTGTPPAMPLDASNATASGSLGINVAAQLPLNQSNATASGTLDLTTTSAVGSRAAPGWLGLFVLDDSAATIPLIAGGSTAVATGSLTLLTPSAASISGASQATASGSLILRGSVETRIATPTSLGSSQFSNSTLGSAQFGNSRVEAAVDHPVS